MRNSEHRTLTSHVGSLPRPDELIAANRARDAGNRADEAGFQQILRAAVGEIVRRQQALGIDVPNDGEFGKSVSARHKAAVALTERGLKRRPSSAITLPRAGLAQR